MKHKEIKKQALITGALGGLGLSTARLLTGAGWHVFAVDTGPEIFSQFEQSDSQTPLRMDVTNMKEIKEAYKLITDKTLGLDAIIHGAGILKIGSLAERPVSDLEQVLEVNLLSIYRLNQQFLPLLLNQKGKIIILSSEVARQSAAPFNGFYSISKHALEAYSDALRRELAFLDLRVIKIQPGPFRTNMTRNAEQMFATAQKESRFFKKYLSKGIGYLPKVYQKAHDPIHVARTVLRILNTPHPKTRYLVKTDKLRMMLDLLPTKLTDALYKKILS